MFKNISIRKNLIFGYAVTVVLSVVIILASFWMSMTQSSSYAEIFDTIVAADTVATEVKTDANIVSRNLRDLVLLPEDPDRNSKLLTVESTMTDIKEKLARLQDLYTLDDKQLLSEYVTTVNNWSSDVPAILAAINAGQYDYARTLIQQDTTKVNAMANYDDKLNEAFQTAINDALRYQDLKTRALIFIMVIVMIIATVFVVFMAAKIIRSIIVPTEQVRKALIGFSQGNLDLPVTYEANNELGDMCDALRTSQHVLKGVIDDICYLLREMGAGNFDVRSKATDLYVGALKEALEAVREINRNLSDTLTQISHSADQVSSGSEQVSTGAQALAQGATEQASAVEELSATINDISNSAKNNAQNSEMAIKHSRAAQSQVAESAKYMNEMTEAMGKIAESSEEIGKIIATIENIAFQTNILALNAAVEAARAGSAGKGFAVVADEVRNLATKSDQAAKATTELIEHSISSVQAGSDIVENVSTSLKKTVELFEETLGAVEKITKAAEEEAEAISQVTEGIDQISSVVQTNSATSEESAAASEELSSQANLMKDLMAHFRLRTDSVSFKKESHPATQYQALTAGGSASYDNQTNVDVSAFSKY